jgi:DNA repair protein RAD7
LQVLSLSECVGIKHVDVLIRSLEGPFGRNLRQLYLSQVTCANNALAMCIQKECQEFLEELDMSWCRSVSENAFGKMVDALPQLKRITLFGCSQLTDRFRHGIINDEVEVVL